MTFSWRRRLRLKWLDYKWLIFSALILVILGLGYTGFSKLYASLGETRTPLDILYRTLQLLTLESGFADGIIPWELELARLLAPAVAAYAALMTLSVIFKKQFQLLRLRFFKEHLVICGLGRKGVLLAQKFREQGSRVVVIELDEGNDLVEQCRESGATVLIGNAASQELLCKARIHKAKYLIAVCGDDGINAEIAVLAFDLVGKRKGKVLTCIIHIVEPQLCRLLEKQEIGTRKIGAFRLEFFNIFDKGAWSWLGQYSPFLDTEGMRISKPHLLIVGAGRMGMSLIAQAARKWKESSPNGNIKICVTIIDTKSEAIKKLLDLRYPVVRKSCSLKYLQMDIESSDFEEARFLFDKEKKCDITSIFICLDNDSFGLSTALILHRRTKKYNIPIMVRMARDAGLARLLHRGEKRDDSYAALHVFGLLDRTCHPEQVLLGTKEILARAIHEDYRNRQKKKGETSKTNPSLVSWDELPEDLQESNRQQADHIGEKLKDMGYDVSELENWDEKLFEFAPEEIEMMAKVEHKRWVEERKRSGWRLGQKNIKRKKTPYLIPWDELDEETKEKDRAPVRNLPFYLREAGYKIYRLDEKDKQ